MKKETAKEIRTYTIYKIETDVKEITGYADGIWIPCYIGSTCQALNKRMNKHMTNKKCTLLPYAKKYGRKHFRIIAMFTVNTTLKIAHKYEEVQTLKACKIFTLLNRSIGDRKDEKTKCILRNKYDNDKCKARKIYCKELGKVYESIREAAEDLNIGYSNLRCHLQGISKYCSGYRFCYLEDKDTFNFSVEKNTKKIRCVETQQIFNSIQECANYFHTTHSTISIAVNKPRPYKKFHLEYVKEDE